MPVTEVKYFAVTALLWLSLSSVGLMVMLVAAAAIKAGNLPR